MSAGSFTGRLKASLVATAAAIAALVGLSALAYGESVTTASDVIHFVTVRAKPTTASMAVGKLKKDEVAELLGSTNYYWKVQLPSGLKGYVSKRWTAVIIEPASADQNLVVTFVDVDEGDAILLQVGSVDLLVDTGKSNAWSLSLGKTLSRVDGSLDALFISHPHLDHFGGAADVLANLNVKKVYTNGERRGPPRDPKALPTWDAFVKAVKDEGLSMDTLKIGEVLKPAPGLAIEVLATGSPAGGQFADTSSGTDINNDSLVLMVEFGGRRLLLTGDIEIAAGERLVEAYCENQDSANCPKLRADVLKVPHHGSASFFPGFFDAVTPDWAVTTAAFESTAHCLPRADTNDKLLELGTKLISTSADGNENVVLTVNATGTMSWMRPTSKIFAWRKKAGAPGKCGVTKQYEQGM